eukprot:CAMPEP_0175101404 /NCGR_PEP_ID=MMETSP0086_2-20121207/7776_1 /TAXON_ID=136419 /ORGANISM="Unknown Unknown, Strain D1" /LENGTH=232 /DNA_ID=CAMNT_0016375927 /DNA_START=195 /DNA_END=893 /DNA_ORIENTATION=+
MKVADLWLRSPDTPGFVTYAWTDSYRPPTTLCSKAAYSLSIPNAGGKSNISEAYSIDMFVRGFAATDVLCENEVKYWAEICFGGNYKMVDFICTIQGCQVGVSVTRAMSFPIAQPEKFTYEDAERLVFKKVNGLVVSRECVTEDHSFSKSVLHIFCQTQRIADLVLQAWNHYQKHMEPQGEAGVLMVMATVTNAREIYTNNFRSTTRKRRLPKHLAKKAKKMARAAHTRPTH